MGYTELTDCMRAEDSSNPLTGISRRLTEQGHAVLFAIAICLIAGMAIPLPGWGLDVLLIINVCLTAALVLIGFSGKSSGELGSLPGLLIATTLLRILGHAASARRVYSTGSGGVILTVIGDMTGFLQSGWVRLVWPAAAFVVLIAIVQTAGKMHQAYVTFVEDTVVAKELQINSEFRKGNLNRTTAEEGRRRLEVEIQFYRGLAGSVDVLRIEGVVVALVISFLSVGLGGHGIDSFGRPQAQLQYLPLLTGAAIAAILPEFLITLGCRRLAGVLAAGWPKSIAAPPGRSEKITIVSEQTGQSEEVELLNPDFREIPKESRPVQAEQVVDFEPQNNGVNVSRPTEPIRFANTDDYYLSLCRRIWSAGKVILLAARDVGDLPVTVAVNLAMRLAESEDKVLMIDVEKGRNALGDVFDLRESSAPQAVASCIENVHVWMGRDFEEWTENECSAAMEEYQRVLIYAPQIGDWPGEMALARKTDRILLFGQTDSPDSPPAVWGRTAEPIPGPEDIG
jgi:hypothetical protein